MEQMNFHKRKLYAIIAAAVALLALFLPWLSVNFLGSSQTVTNGFTGWGYLSAVGVAGVAFFCLSGDRSTDFAGDNKRFVLFAFGAIALGAVLFLLRKNNMVGPFGNDLVKTGIGLWICLVAGLAGMALAYGLVKLEDKKPATPL